MWYASEVTICGDVLTEKNKSFGEKIFTVLKSPKKKKLSLFALLKGAEKKFLKKKLSLLALLNGVWFWAKNILSLLAGKLSFEKKVCAFE